MPETTWVPTIAQGSNCKRDALNKLINQGRNWPAKPAEPVNANGNDLINLGELQVEKITVTQPIAGAGSPSNLMGKPPAADTPNDGDVLIYRAATGNWEAAPAPSGGGGTYTDPYLHASSPPAGSYALGTICYHTAPIPGGNVGWVYTTSGWKAFGAIEE